MRNSDLQNDGRVHLVDDQVREDDVAFDDDRADDEEVPKQGEPGRVGSRVGHQVGEHAREPDAEGFEQPRDDHVGSEAAMKAISMGVRSKQCFWTGARKLCRRLLRATCPRWGMSGCEQIKENVEL